jgi:hypothetical protein
MRMLNQSMRQIITKALLGALQYMAALPCSRIDQWLT